MVAADAAAPAAVVVAAAAAARAVALPEGAALDADVKGARVAAVAMAAVARVAAASSRRVVGKARRISSRTWSRSIASRRS